MKFIYTIMLALFIDSHTCCMQEITKQNHLEITQPKYDENFGIFSIIAKLNSEEIGLIKYFLNRELGPNTWAISNLKIQQDYRKKNFALILFQECIKSIRKMGGRLVQWFVASESDDLSNEQLKDIYLKMINKTENIAKVNVQPIKGGHYQIFITLN